MPTVTVADATLSYQEHGAGDPLLLIHGFSTTGEAWAHLLPSFVDRYRVIVPDLRGHGRSTGAPETMRQERFGADLVVLLDHLGLARAHVVGHSGGGGASLYVAIRQQQVPRLRTLTLIGVSYTLDAAARAQMHRMAAAWESDPAWAERQRQRHGPTHGGDHWRVIAGRLRASADDPDELAFRLADLGAITCPTLVLWGDRDPFFPVRVPAAMYEALPNAELAVLPGVGHNPHAERPDLLAPLLADFLARHADA